MAAGLRIARLFCNSDHPSPVIKRDVLNQNLSNALKGGILGALISAMVFFFIDDFNWIFVTIIAALCTILSYFNGEGFLLWLRQLWYNIWSND